MSLPLAADQLIAAAVSSDDVIIAVANEAGRRRAADYILNMVMLATPVALNESTPNILSVERLMLTPVT